MDCLQLLLLLIPNILIKNATSAENRSKGADSLNQQKPPNAPGSSEVVWVADVHNVALGPSSRAAARNSGCWIRVSKVAIFMNREDPHILVHIRDGSKRLYPLAADISFGGIVDYGETYEQAAIRETREECGICLQPENLACVRPYSFHEDGSRTHSMIYAALFDGNIDDLIPQKGEVASIFKVRLEDIDQYMSQRPVPKPISYTLRFVKEFVAEGGLTNLLATANTVGMAYNEDGE